MYQKEKEKSKECKRFLGNLLHFILKSMKTDIIIEIGIAIPKK